jgi:glycosyltransferase involved in cell wall biosynthesis
LEQPFYKTVIAKRIDKIVSNIQPAIVNLHGAENPIYSWGAIPLKDKFPILTTIQGFIGRASTLNSKIKIRIRLENKIVRNFKHFGVRTIEMENDILKVNPSAKTHWHNYPINKPPVFQEEEKLFDCVFFARVIKDKGIEDLIHAISIVKEKYNSVSLKIVGPVTKTYKQYLNSLINELNLTENISFAGFFEKQEDMYRYVGKARVCVLPTYHDIIPGTVIESMYMKLPIIAYAVGGIPEINEKQENIGLVERKDIQGLADKITELLNDEELRKKLANGAYYYTSNRFVNTDIPNDLYKIYNKVIKDFNREKAH